MTRVPFARSTLPPKSAALVWAALASAGACGRAADDARPNILIYVADTLRADALGCYGNTICETPNLDRFAAGGVLFDAAFAQSSWTRASMASLLTGQHPRVHGAQDRQHALSERALLLSEILRESGYATCLITTNPNVGRFYHFDQSFDTFVELYDRREAGKVRTRELVTTADEVTDRALAWMRSAPRPFALVALAIDPHSPYAPPAEFERFGGQGASEATGAGSWINRDDLSEADRRRIRALYYGEVAFLDDQFGRLLEGMRADEILDETVCVFTSDHGEEFWEHGDRGHGKTLFDEVLRVPLIARFPAGIPVGQRETESARLIDVLPTVLALAGVERPAGIEGRALFASSEPPAALFATLELDGKQHTSVRAGPWKLIADGDSGEQVLYAIDAGEKPVPKPLSGTAADAFERLAALLERHQEDSSRRRVSLLGSRAAPTVDEGAQPQHVLDQLRVLGYIGGDGDDG